MLRRLADMGVATMPPRARISAASVPFRWSDLERARGRQCGAGRGQQAVDSATRAAKPPPAEPPATKAEAPAKPEVARKAATASASTAVGFSSTEIEPTGLAYDAVSGRFLVGDRTGRKLAVIGERSRRVANFAGVDGGLGDITAFEIDAREGDLWVVSSTAVHKLQLICRSCWRPFPWPRSRRITLHGCRRRARRLDSRARQRASTRVSSGTTRPIVGAGGAPGRE
jgi:hypothetical protein